MRNIIVIIAAVIGIAGGVGYFLMRGKIDTKDADQKIKDALDHNVAPTSKVDCPKADRKKGSTFTCKVTFASGKEVDLGIEITSDDGCSDVAHSFNTPGKLCGLTASTSVDAQAHNSALLAAACTPCAFAHCSRLAPSTSLILICSGVTRWARSKPRSKAVAMLPAPMNPLR